MILLSISSGWESFIQLISVLFIFLLVLALTYITTKWVAKYQQGTMTNKNIRIIESFRLTNNKFIQIIKVGEKYLVISVCKDTIQALAELTEEQLTWIPPEYEAEKSTAGESFQEILNKLKGKFPRK